jgi:acetyl-CoA acetyltransferase
MDARIVSYGSSPYEKQIEHSFEWHAATAAADCLERAGLDRDEVDGLTLAAYGYSSGNVVTLAEHLGLALSWAHAGAFGGASGVIAVREAVAAVSAGRARAVLCLAADTYTVQSHDVALGSFTPAIRDYLAPHGFGGANGLFALVQRRHSHLYGTTREQLGRLCVVQRDNALLNENALFQRPLTLDEYLVARPIAEPIHLYDCVMPCSGAEAVLVVADGIAEDLDRPPVRMLAGGERHNAHPDTTLPLQPGWEQFADELFETAGRSRADVDVAQLYDDYPIMVGIQLESLGFCAPGGCGEFFAERDISRAGELSLNTGGGQLSCGQAGAAGGMIGMTEAVRQLQDEGGKRQVDGAETALVSGFGLISYGKGLCVSAALLGADG